MEPRFNEVQRDWGNLFIISRVRYIENHYIMNLWKNNQNVHYIEVWLIIKIIIIFNSVTLIHYPAFPDQCLYEAIVHCTGLYIATVPEN